MILITGITGKSGSWFLKELIQKQNEFKDKKFRVVLRKSSDHSLINDNELNIEKVYGDLENDQFASKVTDNIDTILHIAGIGKSLNLVKAAIKNNVNRLILVHTTGIYSKFKIASHEYLEIEKKNR